jgi:hypothetical protein
VIAEEFALANPILVTKTQSNKMEGVFIK